MFRNLYCNNTGLENKGGLCPPSKNIGGGGGGAGPPPPPPHAKRGKLKQIIDISVPKKAI